MFYFYSSSNFGKGYPESETYYDSGYTGPSPQIEPPRSFGSPSKVQFTKYFVILT